MPGTKGDPKIRCSCACCMERLKRRIGRNPGAEEDACQCAAIPDPPVDPDTARCDCELCVASIAAAA